MNPQMLHQSGDARCAASQARLARRIFVPGALWSIFAAPAAAQQNSAAALMETSYQTTRFASARFRARLTITSSGGSVRTRTLEGLSKTIEGGAALARLIRALGPAEMRGVATLTIDRRSAADDLWIYLPALGRVRRLVASNRRDAWMGSDFTFGDIVGHDVAEWRHATVRRENIQAQPCVVVESTPATSNVARETGYGRRVTWLRESDSFALRSDFFDLSGAPLKSAVAADVRLLDSTAHKSQAMQITMTGARSASVLAFDTFDINVAIDNAAIAPNSLRP